MPWLYPPTPHQVTCTVQYLCCHNQLYVLYSASRSIVCACSRQLVSSCALAQEPPGERHWWRPAAQFAQTALRLSCQGQEGHLARDATLAGFRKTNTRVKINPPLPPNCSPQAASFGRCHPPQFCNSIHCQLSAELHASSSEPGIGANVAVHCARSDCAACAPAQQSLGVFHAAAPMGPRQAYRHNDSMPRPAALLEDLRVTR